MADPFCSEPLCSLLPECLPLLVAHVVSASQSRFHGVHVVIREEGSWGARVGFPLPLYPCVLHLQLLGLDLCLTEPSVEGGDLVRGPRDGLVVGVFYLVDPVGRSGGVARKVKVLASVSVLYPLEHL